MSSGGVIRVVVNGLVLPESLAARAASGRWGPSTRPDSTGLPIVDRDDLVLLSPDGMARNTRQLRAAMADGYGDLLGLAAAAGRAEPGFLDVERAVLIAVTHGQEALALDYSTPGPPRVVATNPGPGGPKWVEVAADVDELLATLFG